LGVCRNKAPDTTNTLDSGMFGVVFHRTRINVRDI